MTAPPNAGLDLAVKLITKIKKDHPSVTWADLLQLASATAVEVRFFALAFHVYFLSLAQSFGHSWLPGPEQKGFTIILGKQVLQCDRCSLTLRIG